MTNSPVCVTAIEQSFAQVTQFQISFDRIANTVFYATQCQIPGLELDSIDQPNPFVAMPVPSDKLTFDPWAFSFIVDSEYNSWNDINLWMNDLGSPRDFAQYANLTKDQVRPGLSAMLSGTRPPYSDASLLIFTNKNNPLMRVDFVDCFPVHLSPLEYDYQKSALDLMTAMTAFKYTYYTITKL